MSGISKFFVGKEDFWLQTNTNAPEQFERKTSVGGTMNLTKMPDIWDGTGRINIRKIVFDNPKDVSGDGVLMKNNGQYAVEVATGKNLSLLHFDFKNLETVPERSYMWGLVINCDFDAGDTGGAIGMTNAGKADTIYIGLKGKAGAVASTPTGLAIDMNRDGAIENSSLFTGYGIQIYDWSQTDIAGGPTGIYLKKQNNLNSGHLLLKLTANKHAIFIDTPEGAGYDGNVLIWGIGTDPTTPKVYFTAGGGLIFSNNKFLEFNVLGGGNDAAIFADDNATSWLKLRGGPAGITVTNNAFDADLLTIPDTGDIFLNPQSGYVKFGTYTVKGAKAFDGYITIKDAAGNVRTIMTCA